jgi:hypothetical protein
MYESTLIVHSLLRWAVVLTAAYSLLTAALGTARNRSWSPADILPHRVFLIAFDIQLLVGLVLYGYASPLMTGALSNVGEAMKTAPIRYWLIEHPLPMCVAVIVAHVGLARAKKLSASSSHRVVLLHTAVAVLLVLASTPWPFLSNGRPWVRFW